MSEYNFLEENKNTNNHEVDENKERVWILYLQGKTQMEIAKELHISQPTVSRWLNDIKEEGKKRIKELGQEGLSLILYDSLKGMDLVLRELWATYNEKRDPKILEAISKILIERVKLVTDIEINDIMKRYSEYNFKNLPKDERDRVLLS